jgi:hypothetical protein
MDIRFFVIFEWVERDLVILQRIQYLCQRGRSPHKSA